jgi:hypothetical protein
MLISIVDFTYTNIHILYVIVLKETYFLERMKTAEASSWISEKTLSKPHGSVKSCMGNKKCLDWCREGVLTQRCGTGLEKYYTVFKKKRSKFAKFRIKNTWRNG